MTIKIKKLHKDATFQKAYSSDSGYDLTPCTYKYYGAGLWMLGLGVQVKPHRGTYFEIVPRSSFSKLPFIMPNNVGIIDQSYRGEWHLPIRSLVKSYFGNDDDDLQTLDELIEKLLIGKRIVQAIVRPVYNLEVEFVSDDYKFPATIREDKGFGSTGDK